VIGRSHGELGPFTATHSGHLKPEMRDKA